MGRRPKIDVDEVYTTVMGVVARDQDRRDTYLAEGHSPRYQVRGAPSCLVAAVLAELGCSAGVLRDLDREAGHGKHRGPVEFGSSRHRYLQRFTSPAQALLDSLQRHQDTGVTWKTAADRACGPTPHWLDARHHRQGRPWAPPDSGQVFDQRPLPAQNPTPSAPERTE
ncbi:hypothetical protein [Nocardia miyunensis]|uniref:hypothetical protein n=1 Tax=Nocardia miyunensis TaxID=282684 RepID=UPI00082A40EA|nr:hypothetical protein [Nocardia miyunensis]